MRCTAIAALAVAACLPLLAPSAAAQEEKVNRGQTVNERGRPTYDAKGIPVGGFVLYPVLDLSETYNDNIFAEPTNEDEDFETVIRPGAGLQSRWSRHELDLSAYGVIHRFADHDVLNTTEYGANASFRLDLAREASFTGSGGYEHRTVSRTDPEVAQRDTPEEVNVTTGSASFTQPFVNLRLTVSGDVVNYDEVETADSDKNRIEYEGRVRLGYDFSPALTTFLQPFYSLRDYDLAVDSAGINQGFECLWGRIRRWPTTSPASSTARRPSAITRPNFSDAQFTNDSGIFVDSKTTWNVTSLTSIIARIGRENITTNEIIFGLASSSRRQVRVGVEIQHELTSNVIINANGGYKREQFLQTTRSDKTVEAGVNVRFLINNYVSLFASYDYGVRNSNDPDAEYTDNRFLIGVRGQL